MTLREYIKTLQEFLQENPKLADATVIYSGDDEGNDFHEVDFEPTMGFFEDDCQDFVPLEQFDDADFDPDEDVNAVCIN